MEPADELHPLLRHQLDTLALPEAAAPAMLLQRVSCAYADADRERDRLLGHAQTRTSALELSEARLQNLVSLSADWIWEQDAELRMSYISEGVRSATGLDPQQLLGKRRESFIDFDAPVSASAEYQACVAAHQPFRNFTYGLRKPDGGKCWIRISGEPIFAADGSFAGYRGVGSDVTAATLAARQVEQLARFDSLTGLPNRATFMDELERALARARRLGHTFAVGFIDLDRFKNINDSLGHAAGDELLKVMARRLPNALRETDLVARLGGDEFVVLIEGHATAPTLALVGQKLLGAICEPLAIAGRAFQISASLGLALFPGDGDDAATLLKHADAAMYQAKAQGKNNTQFYARQLSDKTAREFALEADLRQAVARDELVLHYQPKVTLAGDSVRGVEALLRWAHPQHGLLSAGEFIPLAEERGLIVPIGRWVIQAACRQLRDWRAAGVPALRCAVNLSALQLSNESLIDDITAAITGCALEPAWLEVEITESALMADPVRANGILQRLHALGVHITIDDFGIGYSSLAYLKRFPAQTLKIDRSFVSGLPDDRDDLAITRAIIAITHSLELNVVGEGVETEAQLALLRRLGCDEAQGYLLGRPMAAQALVQLLAARGTRGTFAAA